MQVPHWLVNEIKWCVLTLYALSVMATLLDSINQPILSALFVAVCLLHLSVKPKGKPKHAV